jgi:hypothetical protein
MVSRIIPCLAVLTWLVSAPAFSQEHPEHPKSGSTSSEHPDAKSGTPLTMDQLAAGIEGYIKDDSKLKGGPFLVFDPVDKKALQLELVKVHTEKLASLGGGVYFACTDMKNDDGTLYDLDFFMKQKEDGLQTTEVAVHKKSGQPRYGWKEENGTWKKVKS